MGFDPRPYQDIVRDVLTTLTGGTVREQVVAPTEGPIVLDRLAGRPVRRISNLDGVTDVGGTQVAVRFTEADFELVDTDGDGVVDAVSFREAGRRPAPGSTLTVNYYPVQTRPAPLTDLNVGSVVRTILESVSREVAFSEQYLERVYRSAFLATAESTSLDRVVELIGVTRLPASNPLARIRFSRNADGGGRVTIPAGTVVSDAADNRYATVTALTLEPGEPSREVLAAGVTAETAAVAAGALDRPEVAIAGISIVTNTEPAYRPGAPESDDELRRRAKGALSGAVRGTVDALRFGVLSVPGVKDVTITEYPNGVPGEVRIDVAYTQPDDATAKKAVNERIDEVRPAGIRVTGFDAGRKALAVRMELVLAGTGVSGVELSEVVTGAEERVAARLSGLAPGGNVRVNALTAAALEDGRIADVTFSFSEPGGGPVSDPALAAGEVLDVIRPFDVPPPTSESAGPAVATVADVDLVLRITLEPGVTLADATEAIRLAADSHLAGRSPAAPLAFDGLAAAIKDDSRFALLRDLSTITVEHQGRFAQLVDGAGSYQPGAAETMTRRTFDVSEGPQ